MTDLILSKVAEKEFSKLTKKDQKKIFKKFLLLQHQPLSGKKLLGKLKGLYSLKAWPYRIVYKVSGKNKVIVHHILHRQKAYK